MSDFTAIEKKWQTFYQENKVFAAQNVSEKKKYFYLVEFPYPSGDGLHVGHTRGYTALDVMARKKRMEGYNVLFPMAWDAFGEAAEGYAIKHKIHPKEAVAQNIKTFKEQCKKMGYSFDWDREFSTTDPEYMKWTQWQFLKFFEHGMAYKAPAKVNWCPRCKITKSNEESAGGICDRCNTPVVEVKKEQWMLRMKDYAQDLLDGLDETHFQEQVKTTQINWIGKSEGLEIAFEIEQLPEEKILVFTTRPDTIYGVSSIQLSTKHPILSKHRDLISNISDVYNYIEEAESQEKQKLEERRKISDGATKQEKRHLRKESFKVEKEKTGILLVGLKAINPVNGKRIPIYVSNYVISNKGAGAVMSVPAHDQRDYDFAKKYGTEIIPVVDGGDLSICAYTGDGLHINSEYLNGLNNEQALQKIKTMLVNQGIATLQTNYRLEDWVFSRQRFWGEPIPLVYCKKHGWVPVPENELPVTLPDIANYEPTDNGESPLANILNWVNTKCPICGAPAKRETDTMPGWAGSSWYWLRFMDPHNNETFAGMNAMKYWGKVDFYDGGMEHAARHLLYARFWNQFLFNIGLVPYKEPVDIRIAHGMVLGAGGVKMSKSLGNVVRPDTIVNEYGADALRIYMMFMGDFGDSIAWEETGVKSARKFIERIIKLGTKIKDGATNETLDLHINRTIKKVTDDINATKFNTAISALHELTRACESLDSINKKEYRNLLILLHPFAPHITEELNEQYKLGKTLALSEWPKYDERKLIKSNIEIVVQINGKLRSRITIPSNKTADEMKTIALNDDKVQNYIKGHTISKIIVIQNKVVSIVLSKEG